MRNAGANKIFVPWGWGNTDMALADKLNPVSATSAPQPPFEGVWNVSDCIGCPAALLHKAAGCPIEPISASLRALFNEGLMHEALMKQQLRDAGAVVVEINQGIFHPSLPVFGHIDGFVDGDLTEFKTIGDEEEVDELLNNHPRYTKQVHGYMDLVKKNFTRLIAKIRKTGWVLPDLIIDYDPEVATAIWKNVETAANLYQVKSGQIQCPSKEPYMQCSDDYKVRFMCPYYNEHCTREPKMASDALDKMLFEYAGIDNWFSEARTSRENARHEIESVIQAEGGFQNRFKSKDGVTVSKYPSSRKGLDWQTAMQLVPQDVLNKITTETRSEVMRITVPKHLKSGQNQMIGGGKESDD